MPWWRLSATAVALVCCVGAATAVSQERHLIRLDPPQKAGESHRFNVSASGETDTEHSRWRGGTRKAEMHTQWQASMSGTERVVAVDKAGTPTALEIVVGKSSYADENPARPMFPAGTRLLVTTRGGKTVSSRGGVPLEPREHAVVTYLFVVYKPGTPRTAEVFGSGRRAVVGEQWPVNAAALARFYAPIPGSRDPHFTQGTVRFDSVVRQRGVPCARIKIVTQAQNYVPQGFNAFEAQASRRVADFTLYQPLDVSLPLLAFNERIEWHYHGKQESEIPDVPWSVWHRSIVTRSYEREP